MENYDFIYYGLFIDKETMDSLIDYLKKSFYKDKFEECEHVFLDHCTLLHVSQMNESQAEDVRVRLDHNIGAVSYMKIRSIGISDKAMAFGVVTPVVSKNKIPHITIGTFNGGKPVDSNFITEWFAIEPIVVSGTVNKIVPKNKKSENEVQS